MEHELENDKRWTEGLDIVHRLEHNGHRAYLVGGCVRDKLLGRPLHDIDIATSAKPEEVLGLFSRTLPTGLKHGTVTVMEEGSSFEVTTFRQEGDYTDARRPDEVSFVLDVKEDLARRDFTFNAMAFGSDGKIVDPFGGQDALRAGVVQCVGQPSERFGEDALRMLRAIRFAAEFGFDILPDVWEGIISNRGKLAQVAMERVSAEWDKMMAGGGPEQACHYLFKSGLLVNVKESLPESFRGAAERYRLNGSDWHWEEWGALDSDESSSGNLLYLPLLPDADLRWAALLIGMGVNGSDTLKLFRSLRISGKRAERIAAIADFHESLSAYDESTMRHGWIKNTIAHSRSIAEDLLSIREACGETVFAEREWLTEMSVSSVAELDVKGDELSRYLGVAPGPWISVLLQRLLEEAASGRIPNDKGSLLSEAKSAMRNMTEERK
ncbi:CCA tRNA nucleotidyltransferase [Cohnella terricola]|uniref:CCA tRNA nucleotidyltransferase n=1 Tax=Cohnella terricola TaxID=1289167 RepID=A0A559JXI3_9BACL|nr:CCA tRNA nucleotidyltransferase [Cohnella terricola]TVY04598.1 CCA tRNA nucleotidyltransferase [Cohnella terricola]